MIHRQPQASTFFQSRVAAAHQPGTNVNAQASIETIAVSCRRRVNCGKSPRVAGRPLFFRAFGGGAAGCLLARLRVQLDRLRQLTPKIGRLARNSKLGDDGAVTTLGNPYRRVRVGP